MFRRPLRRGLGRALRRTGQMDEFTRVSQLLAAGQAGQAAALLAQMAEGMQANGRPRQAANLHAQAAHAWVDAGDEQRASEQARQAVALFSSIGLNRRAADFQARIERRLQRLRTPDRGIASDDMPAARTPAQRGRLPGVCPNCGAPLRSDSVDWIDERSARCDFCDSTIYTEE